MNSRRRLIYIQRLFDILLLYVNSIGIMGALLEVLEVPWGSADRMLFWAVLFCFCITAVFFWNGEEWKRLFKRSGICAGVYLFLILVFNKEVWGGFFLGLRGAVENLNERYQFHLTWPDSLKILREAGWERGSEEWIILFAVLMIILPFIMLAGLMLTRGRIIWLLLGNLLWFTAACTCDIFPDFFYLVFCILGAVAVLVRREFGENCGAGLAAVAWVLALSGVALGLTYFYLMPVMDEKYEEGYDDRIQFYKMVNDEWIPWVWDKVSGFGVGSGTDVTGTLNRRDPFAYTAEDIYQVTVDGVPEGVLYLKGFVGADYGKKEWSARSDRDLEEYYEKAGFQLPKDYSLLPSISYEAVGRMQENQSTEHIQIEELANRGSYSVYPYGALLTEDYRVHADGSVVRKDREYGFLYRYLGGLGGTGILAGKWDTLERQYRKYVHDSFLEYPQDLEHLAEALDKADIRTDSVYHCAADIMTFLDRHAVYELDAGKNPSGTDFVEYFLFESHEGYCVHFASSAVLALRYFGIPARYATGYVVSPCDFKAAEKGTYTAVVTSKQAHAWAEIYLDGIGWVPVEMTPGAVAVEGDNRAEQLAGIGELTGEGHVQPPSVRQEGEALPPEILEPTPSPKEEQSSEPGSDSEAEEPGEEPEESTEEKSEETPKLGPQEASEEMPEDKEPGEEAKEKESDEESEEKKSESEPEEAPDKGDEKGTASGKGLIVVLEVLAAISLPSALLLLGKYMHNRAVLRWQRNLREAGARRQVLLLYQNLRKVLGLAGCPEYLEVDGEAFWRRLEKLFPRTEGEAEEFQMKYLMLCSVLEKASFSLREPSWEQVGSVIQVHDELVWEAYEKLPLYKKPLFILRGCHRSAQQ